MDNIKHGWYFNFKGIEYFVETKYKTKSQQLIEGIIRQIKTTNDLEMYKYLKQNLIQASLEVKHCPAIPDMNVKEHDYYNIFGSNFSGYGSEDINDGKTIILSV